MIKTVKTIHYLIIVFLFPTGPSYGNLEHNIQQNNRFFKLEQTSKILDPDHLDMQLLENALIYFTNEARKEHSIKACLFDTYLQQAARAHSEEMVRLEYFSHGSPVLENRRLVDRIRKTGIVLGNTIVGENIGVDYLLRIANVPYYVQYKEGKIVYISGDTGEPIGYQTYREFAYKMVLNWMNSPGHRENILNGKFHRIGIGIALGKFKGIESIYVTQNFLGSFKQQK